MWNSRLLVAISLALACTSAATADTMTIGGFGGSRVYRPFSGSEYDNIRGRLLNPANFGPSGTVSHSVQFAADTLTATSEYLSTIDLFVMTEVDGMLSSTEADALSDFVLSGGCLVMISDTLHVTKPYGHDGSWAANQVLQRLGGGLVDSNDTVGQGGLVGAQTATAGTLLNVPSSSVLHGPFGSFGAADHFGSSFHNILTAGANSRVLGTRAGTGILMEIPDGAAGPNAGGVLIAGDIIFSDSFVPPAPMSLANENNARLFMNFVASCECCVHNVPEPATATLASFGAIFVLGALRRRCR